MRECKPREPTYSTNPNRAIYPWVGPLSRTAMYGVVNCDLCDGAARWGYYPAYQAEGTALCDQCAEPMRAFAALAW